MAQLFFTGVNISVRYLCVKARIHYQALPYDNATCLMFHSYVGWPRTATRPDSVGRNGRRSLFHCFTEVGVYKCDALFSYGIGSPLSDKNRRQTLTPDSGYVRMCILPYQRTRTSLPYGISPANMTVLGQYWANTGRPV